MNFKIIKYALFALVTIINNSSYAIANAKPKIATLLYPININMTENAYIWNKDSSATWYYLWVNDASGKTVLNKWYKAEQVCNNEYKICGVLAPTDQIPGVYKWWIQTWNESGYGPRSDPASFAVSVPWKIDPAYPANTTVDTKFAYFWNKSSDATWYYLWVNDASGKTVLNKWYKAEQVCNDEYEICGVLAPTGQVPGVYKWWIQTWNESGYGPWSDPASFAVSVPLKATPALPINGMAVSTWPEYLWRAVPQATWYYLWVNDASGKTVLNKWYKAEQVCNYNLILGIGICGVPAPTYQVPGVYKWWIQTWNESGYGPWSDEGSFVVQASGNSTAYVNASQQTKSTVPCELNCGVLYSRKSDMHCSQAYANDAAEMTCRKGIRIDNEKAEIDRNNCIKDCRN